MIQAEKDRRIAKAVAELFDKVLRPGNPTGLGTNPEFIDFAMRVRRVYPSPTELRARCIAPS